MFSSFLRQYRRIALCTLLGLAALLIFLWMSPDLPGQTNLWSPLGIAVMTAISFAFSCALLTILMVLGYKYLQLAENLLLALIVMATVSALLPDDLVPLWVAVPLIVVLSLVIDYFLGQPYWKWSERSCGPFSTTFSTDFPPDLVWRRLYPDPAYIKDFVRGGATVVPLPGGPDGALLLSYTFRGISSGRMNTGVHLDSVTLHRHFRSRYFTYGGPPGPWNPEPSSEAIATEEVSIMPTQHGSRVTTSVVHHNLTLPEQIKHWLGGWDAEATASDRMSLSVRPKRTLLDRYSDPPSNLTPGGSGV